MGSLYAISQHALHQRKEKDRKDNYHFNSIEKISPVEIGENRTRGLGGSLGTWCF